MLVVNIERKQVYLIILFASIEIYLISCPVVETLHVNLYRRYIMSGCIGIARGGAGLTRYLVVALNWQVLPAPTKQLTV